MSQTTTNAVMMVPLHTIILMRAVEGKTDKAGRQVYRKVIPQIGGTFAFTAAEVADIEKMTPNALRNPQADPAGSAQAVRAAGTLLSRVATPLHAGAVPAPKPIAVAPVIGTGTGTLAGAGAETEDDHL
jgi:hypothetical protein